MDRVTLITNATQQIIRVLNGADRHLIAGGAGQRRAQAADRERLSGQACFGPPSPGSTVTRRFIRIAPLDPDDGTFRERPPKMPIGHGHPQRILRQAIEILQLAQTLAHAPRRSTHSDETKNYPALKSRTAAKSP